MVLNVGWWPEERCFCTYESKVAVRWVEGKQPRGFSKSNRPQLSSNPIASSTSDFLAFLVVPNNRLTSMFYCLAQFSATAPQIDKAKSHIN